MQSERKVKTLSNDLGLPQDFRDAISSLPDDHVILGVKGVSFSAAGGADAGEENLQQPAARMWNQVVLEGKWLDFTVCVVIPDDSMDLDQAAQGLSLIHI